MRDLEYYQNIDKVYWECGRDITCDDGTEFKLYQRVPCLFVEKAKDGHKIIDFDHDIETDNYRYTGWRKVIGLEYGIRVGVYLISSNQLYTLEGKLVDFNGLGMSQVLVSKKFLGIMDLKQEPKPPTPTPAHPPVLP